MFQSGSKTPTEDAQQNLSVRENAANVVPPTYSWRAAVMGWRQPTPNNVQQSITAQQDKKDNYMLYGEGMELDGRGSQKCE